MTWRSIGLESPLQTALFYCEGDLTSGGGWGDGFLYGNTNGDSYRTEKSGIHDGCSGPAPGGVGGGGLGGGYDNAWGDGRSSQ